MPLAVKEETEVGKTKMWASDFNPKLWPILDLC